MKTRSSTRSLVLSLLGASSLAGCTVGPNYVTPIPPPSAVAPFVGAASPAVSVAEPEQDWWRLYRDPVLDRLIVGALAANTAIRVAVARIERARASLRGARSEALPQTDISGSGGYGQASESQALLGQHRQGRSVDLGLPIPVGDGRVLLARRPDVRTAERRLAADTARIGVSTGDLYPRISLGGAIGSSTVGPADIFGGGALRWLVGPMISWAFSNQEAIRALIGGARADASADLANFDGTVLRALGETETALSAYQNALARRATLTSAHDAATAAARISLARQRVGEIDFLSLLDAQRTLAQSDADLAEATQAVAIAQVDLFRPLGGSWAMSGTAASPTSAVLQRTLVKGNRRLGTQGCLAPHPGLLACFAAISRDGNRMLAAKHRWFPPPLRRTYVR